MRQDFTAGAGHLVELLLQRIAGQDTASVVMPPELVVRLSEVGQRLGRAIDPLILTPEEVDAGLARNDSHVAAALGGIRLRGSV